MMLTEICTEIKNFFTYDSDKHFGDFSIIDGKIASSFNIPTDYVRIAGSHLNDGVHKLSDADLKDEEFHGAIWVMSPPDAFLKLAEEIEEWQKKNGAVDSNAMSPFNSESFGGYTYSKSSGSENTSTWVYTFSKRLNHYRRIRL